MLAVEGEAKFNWKLELRAWLHNPQADVEH